MKQKQISKQSQLIDQNFSNEIMLNAIAALENLSFFYGFNGKRIFDYYSGYANRNNEAELINAVILQLEIFRSSHSNYSMNYDNYDFPKNLSKEQIIKIIKEWKKYAPDKSKIYYKEILNYISGNSNYSGISDVINKKKQEWGPTTKEDLERVGRSAPFTNTHMFNQMDKIKQSYSKTGKYEIMANLNKNREDNVDMHEFNEFDQKYTTQKQTFYAIEKEIEKYFEKLLVHNSFQESDVNQLNKLVDMLKNSINGINFEEVEIKQRIAQYKSFNDEILRSVKDKNALNYFFNICNEILTCYQKRNIYSYC